VFLFDIDNFKSYNDSNGHLAGDKLLQELAGLVSDSVRRDDIFGRFGGEEFLLVLPHTNASQAGAAAEKIRSLLADHPFPFREKQPLGRISVSGGIAEYPHHGLDAAGLLHAADEALYEAKRAGRNKVFTAREAAGAEPAPGASASQGLRSARP
jgi:diguanylate cyclase (GGDEF)-like protein